MKLKHIIAYVGMSFVTVCAFAYNETNSSSSDIIVPEAAISSKEYEFGILDNIENSLDKFEKGEPEIEDIKSGIKANIAEMRSKVASDDRVANAGTINIMSDLDDNASRLTRILELNHEIDGIRSKIANIFNILQKGNLSSCERLQNIITLKYHFKKAFGLCEEKRTLLAFLKDSEDLESALEEILALDVDNNKQINEFRINEKNMNDFSPTARLEISVLEKRYQDTCANAARKESPKNSK